MSETLTTVRERPILFSGAMVRAILDGRKSQTRRVVTPQLRYIGRCPYGQPGDRLWVKETHYVESAGYRDGSVRRVLYRATELDASFTWTPSRFMPRWASRLTLEITDTRIERLQEITEGDAMAEGVGRGSWPEDCTEDDGALKSETGYFPPRSHTAAFAALWDSLNAKRGYGWDVNPFCWVLTFRSITTTPAPSMSEEGR